MLKINVSECHLCHRCPRLLAYQAAGSKHAWKVGLKGGGHFPGTLFHNKIAAPFHQALASAETSPLKQALADLLAQPRADLELGLHALVQEHILTPVIGQQIDHLKTDQIVSLSRGVEFWCRHLTHFLEKNHFRDGRNILNRLSDLFLDPEKNMITSFTLPNGRTIQISGTYDSLLLDRASGEVVIIELKGFKPNFQDEEYVQVGLYGWLISQLTGISPRGVVLYLDEDEPEVLYSAEELSQIRNSLPDLFETTARIKTAASQKGRVELPLTPYEFLCTFCPMDSQCDQDWGTKSRQARLQSRPGHPEPEKSDPLETPSPAPDTEADRLLAELDRTLTHLKLPIEPLGYILGPRLVRLKVKPVLEKGTTVKKIMAKAEDLQVALALPAAPLIQAQAGYLSLDLPRKRLTPLTLSELMEKGEAQKPGSPVAFPLGMAVDGSVVWADLAEPTMTSVLVAGSSGSGKSVFLRSVIISLAMSASPSQLRFTLIDPKRVSFTDLNGLPHLNGSPIIMDLDPARRALADLVREMEERYLGFAGQGLVDIEGSWARGDTMPHHVVLIDEYGDLMTDKEEKAELEILIARLCQKGRASGIHLILSTQHPSAKVVTPLIKANLQLKVALKVTTSTNSQVILDETGAERLLGHGDMLVGGAIPLIRLQGAIATKTEIDQAMAPGQ